MPDEQTPLQAAQQILAQADRYYAAAQLPPPEIQYQGPDAVQEYRRETYGVAEMLYREYAETVARESRRGITLSRALGATGFGALGGVIAGVLGATFLGIIGYRIAEQAMSSYLTRTVNEEDYYHALERAADCRAQLARL